MPGDTERKAAMEEAGRRVVSLALRATGEWLEGRCALCARSRACGVLCFCSFASFRARKAAWFAICLDCKALLVLPERMLVLAV